MRIRLALAVVMMLAFVARPARADDDVAKARVLYDKAIAHYDLAEYDTAIDEFKQAYELTRQPALLFNIAQSYRLKKDYEQAIHFYRTFLELEPDAPNRHDAETQLRKMKEALKAAQRPRSPAPAPPPPPAPIAPSQPTVAASPPAPVVAPPPAPRPSFVHTRRGQATIAIAAVGAAALIAAAGTGGEALSIRSRYDASCNGGACDGALYSRGRGFAIATDVLLSVGVVAAVAATVVALVHRRERPLTVGMRF